MTAAALPNQMATGQTQQLAQFPIELRRHSATREFGFAKGGDLQEELVGRDVRVIVGQ